MYTLTEKGKETVAQFIAECKALRKEILDAGKDTADEVELPDEESILEDVAWAIEDGEYCNCWGVTDNYNSDPLCLRVGEELRRTNK